MTGLPIQTFPGARGREISRWMLAVLLPLLLWSCAVPVQDLRPSRETVQVRFFYPDVRAGEVCVAGSFNGWSTESHCMGRSGKAWTMSFYVPRGRYEYLFVVDGGIWVPDPGNDLTQDNGFGGRNSVLIVE